MRYAVKVEGLGKRFRRFHGDRPLTFQEAVVAGLRRMTPVEEFWALRDVSFTVFPGEMLGILGQNGAGKSTLLQLVGGVGRADEGKVKVNGQIGALLDLGAGFHSDLTGRENVFVSGVVAGLTRREVARRFDEILAFAELESFIDNPLRTYSSGMQMRLAFSTAIHTDPQVLLVDEFLSVGDIAFQAKCLERITRLKKEGCAIILISHSAEQIEQLCDRAMWLKAGQIFAYGEPEVVAGQYVAEMRSETRKRTPVRPPQMTRSGVELRVNDNRFGSLEVEILDVRLTPATEIKSGGALRIDIEYLAERPIAAPIFGVSISHKDGLVCLDTTTATMSIPLSSIQGHGQISLQIDRLDLNTGDYFADVGVYEQDWKYAYDYHWHTYPFAVKSSIQTQGSLCPPHRWEVSKVTSDLISKHY
ncbi:MAG: ABC transporter ATP-binding protein [Scytolyngbya sp. HA4215-MV1]|nr:ABC transporter ATP-binding protein [Scytolyngbya sp. HA4215-MV1]